MLNTLNPLNHSSQSIQSMTHPHLSQGKHAPHKQACRYFMAELRTYYESARRALHDAWALNPCGQLTVLLFPSGLAHMSGLAASCWRVKRDSGGENYWAVG